MKKFAYVDNSLGVVHFYDKTCDEAMNAVDPNATINF